MNKLGVRDVLVSLKEIRLPLFLAKADIRQRYRRSTLGPFWITISTAVMVACIGLIFGRLFKSPMSEFLPFLTLGLILWNFISASLVEATTVFPSAEAIIKQLPIPLFTHIVRMLARNCYIFFHNIVIYPILCLIVHKSIGWPSLLAIPGFLLLILNLSWMTLLLSIVCARYRDMSQIVISFLQVFFYITPIIWMPSLLPSRTSTMLLDPNPFYHLIEIVRAPLLSVQPSFTNWCFSIFLAIAGWSFSLLIFNKYRTKISYWL